VLADATVVGRIMKVREAAMAAFAKSWRRVDAARNA
jgi:hypothetical protein